MRSFSVILSSLMASDLPSDRSSKSKFPVSRVIAILVLALALIGFLIPVLVGNREERPLTSEVRQELYADHSFVKLSDGMVHYELSGPENGPLVVLVHGFSAWSTIWNGVTPELNAAGYRVLRYDLFGRGLSDRPSGVKHNADLYDRQLLELLDTLKIRTPVNLVGLSMGGAISVVFTARHPERVQRLALLAPAGHPVKLPFTAKLVRMPFIGEYIMRLLGDRTVLQGSEKSLYDAEKNWPGLRELYLEQMQFTGYRKALLQTLRDYPLNDLDAEYSKVGSYTMPVSVIWGREDSIIRVENTERIKTAIPRARIEVLEKAGHIVVYEEPGRVVGPLLAFLRE